MLQMAKSESGFDPAWDWYRGFFPKLARFTQFEDLPRRGDRLSNTI